MFSPNSQARTPSMLFLILGNKKYDVKVVSCGVTFVRNVLQNRWVNWENCEKNCSHYMNDVACRWKLEVLVRVTRLAAAAAASAAAKLSSPSIYRYSCLLCPIIEHPATRMTIILKSEYLIGFTVQHYTLARRLDGLQNRCGCCREKSLPEMETELRFSISQLSHTSLTGCKTRGLFTNSSDVWRKR